MNKLRNVYVTSYKYSEQRLREMKLIFTLVYFLIVQQSWNYAEVTRSNTYQLEDTAITLTKFIDEFKGLFNQLLEQNSMILNMLTKLINKND